MLDDEEEFFGGDPDVEPHEDEASFVFWNNAAHEVVSAELAVTAQVDSILAHAQRQALVIRSLLGDADAYLSDVMRDIAADIDIAARELSRCPERFVARHIQSLVEPEVARVAIKRVRSLLDELEHNLGETEEVVAEEVRPQPEPRTTSGDPVLEYLARRKK